MDSSDRYKSVTFKPFDPVSKRTGATIEDMEGSESFKVSKGAPQVILSLVENKDAIASQIDKYITEFASKGYRALGLARTDSTGVWNYLA